MLWKEQLPLPVRSCEVIKVTSVHAVFTSEVKERDCVRAGSVYLCLNTDLNASKCIFNKGKL